VTKLVTCRDPYFPISKLNKAQHEVLMQEKHEVADWNRIMTDAKVVRFNDAIEFEEGREG
jgi:hypothetical protein